jgi:mRNA interferase RelE/StbE
MKQIYITKTAQKQLLKLEKKLQVRLLNAIEGLKNIPMIGDIDTFKTEKGTFRLRVGEYRILFSIESDIIYVKDIDTRGGIYK